MKFSNYDLVARLCSRSSRSAKPSRVECHKALPEGRSPKISMILLDWSCRESLHALDWLADQDVPREDYEIIWVELFDRVLPEVMDKADVVLTLGQRGKYHKHEGYNAGLLAARGDVINVCDSDAVFPRDFMSSILSRFWPGEEDSPQPLVLMHHQLRTSFTYPPDLTDAETLKDQERWQWWDLVPNAGACMTVRREDAFRFGGFDEHNSYRGYLCGPYDLGWRLVNAGISEVWEDLSTVIWHFAHPDPVGSNGLRLSLRRLFEISYPHVDMHAITAVEHFSTGRLLPLQENPEIHDRRMNGRVIGTEFEVKYSRLTSPRGFTRTQFAVMRALLFVDILATSFWSTFELVFGKRARQRAQSIRPLFRLKRSPHYFRRGVRYARRNWRDIIRSIGWFPVQLIIWPTNALRARLKIRTRYRRIRYKLALGTRWRRIREKKPIRSWFERFRYKVGLRTRLKKARDKIGVGTRVKGAFAWLRSFFVATPPPQPEPTESNVPSNHQPVEGPQTPESAGHRRAA